MMMSTEIGANYLDIYRDILRLKSNAENVQKPTNDVVDKFLGNPLVAGMSLAEIKAAIDNQKFINDLIDNFLQQQHPKMCQLHIWK